MTDLTKQFVTDVMIILKIYRRWVYNIFKLKDLTINNNIDNLTYKRVENEKT